MPRDGFLKKMKDLSVDKGFQFEFYCERCGKEQKSDFISERGQFVASALGIHFGEDILPTSTGETIKKGTKEWEEQHGESLKRATRWALSLFHECPQCKLYVGPECWNDSKNLCTTCAK